MSPPKPTSTALSLSGIVELPGQFQVVSTHLPFNWLSNTVQKHWPWMEHLSSKLPLPTSSKVLHVLSQTWLKLYQTYFVSLLWVLSHFLLIWIIFADSRQYQKKHRAPKDSKRPSKSCRLTSIKQHFLCHVLLFVALQRLMPFCAQCAPQEPRPLSHVRCDRVGVAKPSDRIGSFIMTLLMLQWSFGMRYLEIPTASYSILQQCVTMTNHCVKMSPPSVRDPSWESLFLLLLLKRQLHTQKETRVES